MERARGTHSNGIRAVSVTLLHHEIRTRASLRFKRAHAHIHSTREREGRDGLQNILR
jgi:hypothetical protein